MTKQIPNLFTLLNLVFGCLAIVVILQNGIVIQYAADGTQLIDIPEKIWMASLFIGIAAVVDFLDGLVARLFKASSEMGKQLDSLADVVSFGVAPAMIFYQFLRMSIAQEEDGLNASIIWMVPAFVLAAAGAWRLARFNIDNSQSFGFKGVPIPAIGILVASLPLIYWDYHTQAVVDILLNKWFLYSCIIFLSWLMISKLPMMALKFKDYNIKNNISKIILLAVAIVAALIFHWLAVPIVFIVYIILSLLFKQQPS
ncbi:MAG: CDP-alcohol phosphatidyltransferase family protein [Ferruginibacter sp.]